MQTCRRTSQTILEFDYKPNFGWKIAALVGAIILVAVGFVWFSTWSTALFTPALGLLWFGLQGNGRHLVIVNSTSNEITYQYFGLFNSGWFSKTLIIRLDQCSRITLMKDQGRYRELFSLVADSLEHGLVRLVRSIKSAEVAQKVVQELRSVLGDRCVVDYVD